MLMIRKSLLELLTQSPQDPRAIRTVQELARSTERPIFWVGDSEPTWRICNLLHDRKAWRQAEHGRAPVRVSSYKLRGDVWLWFNMYYLLSSEGLCKETGDWIR